MVIYSYNSLLASSQHNLHDIYVLLCVQCQTPHDGQRNCPKHAEFYSKNKFDELVHLAGFIIRIHERSFFPSVSVYCSSSFRKLCLKKQLMVMTHTVCF
jgi:hypothetical protein